MPEPFVPSETQDEKAPVTGRVGSSTGLGGGVGETRAQQGPPAAPHVRGALPPYSSPYSYPQQPHGNCSWGSPPESSLVRTPAARHRPSALVSNQASVGFPAGSSFRGASSVLRVTLSRLQMLSARARPL